MPRNVAMGGLSVGLTGTSNLSVKNPASYLNLDSLRVMFEVSLQATYSRLHEKQLNSELISANTNSVSLGQISFAFPITSWLKSSFGLVPTSNMSYHVLREIPDPDSIPKIGKYELHHYGNGGFSQVFLGLAAGTSRVSVGANANYQFGSFTRTAELAFRDTVLTAPSGTRQNNYIEAAGFSWDLGLQYRHPLNNSYQLGFGFTYTPKSNLNASRNRQILSVGNHIPDTISGGDTEKGTLQMPDRYAFGLSFERLNRWVIAAEYSAVNFKNYREFSERDPNLSNAYTFRAGMELKGRRLDNDFLNRLTYRVGYHYGTNYIIFDDREIKQFGVSFGVGVPIRRSFTRVDFAVEIGRKGRVDAGQIQENYGRIVIGLSAFDRWFMRPKFD
ncbi:MAG: outer membrane protein transport protein [Bacteroidales bacterium]|nr:outer membrane protein transport protein [Bacteroidales bacterium]